MATNRGRVTDRTVESELSMRVVEYPEASDRCTIYPEGLADHERTTHWISADRDAFVSLDLYR